MQDPFRRTEDEYLKLRGQLATGRITREQYETSLHALMVTDSDGRSWMLGTETGKWHVYDGTRWIPADPFGAGITPAISPEPSAVPETSARPAPPPAPSPAPQYVTAPPSPAKSGGGCGRVLLLGCVGIILACILLGGGGYLALSSGALTTTTLLSLAGMAPARITADNLREDAIQVHVEQLELQDNTFPVRTTLQLDAYDVKSGTLSSPGKYLVTFSLLPDGKPIGTCTLRIGSGEEYQFVPLPDKIVVNRPNNPPTNGTDLLVESSILCRAR